MFGTRATTLLSERRSAGEEGERRGAEQGAMSSCAVYTSPGVAVALTCIPLVPVLLLLLKQIVAMWRATMNIISKWRWKPLILRDRYTGQVAYADLSLAGCTALAQLRGELKELAPGIEVCIEQLAGCRRAHCTVPVTPGVHQALRAWLGELRGCQALRAALDSTFAHGVDVAGMQFVVPHACTHNHVCGCGKPPLGRVPWYDWHRDIGLSENEGVKVMLILIHLDDEQLLTAFRKGEFSPSMGADVTTRTSALLFNCWLLHSVPAGAHLPGDAPPVWARNRVAVLLADADASYAHTLWSAERHDMVGPHHTVPFQRLPVARW